MNKNDILIVCALEMETQGKLAGWNTLYTGVGKVNATAALVKYLFSHTPKLVINYGTAGSKNLNIGELVDCTKFLQRDMDKTALGFKKGQTAFEENIPIMLDFSHGKNNIVGKNLICGTGDNFVQDVNQEMSNIDVFDMESYALAKVCYLQDIPFISYKYVTDNANNTANKDWVDNLSDGISIFENKVLNQLVEVKNEKDFVP
jgi:adenosylhomocysteine nucleosidase